MDAINQIKTTVFGENIVPDTWVAREDERARWREMDGLTPRCSQDKFFTVHLLRNRAAPSLCAPLLLLFRIHPGLQLL
jgi:hypothetical protein